MDDAVDISCVKAKEIKSMPLEENKIFQICQNEKLGRFLVAGRDVTAGEVIMVESPLVKGPSQVTGPVCLSCLNEVTAENSIECVKCGWPLCNKDECNVITDHKPECEWTTKKRKQKVKISHFVSPHKTYECIMAIRCLYMKENRKDVWEKLNLLESHEKERKGSEKYESDKRVIAKFLHLFFKVEEEEFSEDEILRICGIIQVNGHEVPLTDPAYVAIYENASMLEHSCLPNCCKSFTEGGRLVIRATRNISKGEHITICYTDSLWSTINRREHLALTKYFYCECDRCNDPTELGTFYSSLKCADKECEGYVVPQMKMKDNMLPDPSWECISCQLVVPSSVIRESLNPIAHDFMMTDKQNTDSCKLFLNHYTKRNLSLHPNHYFLTDVKLKLAQLYGQLEQTIHSLSDEDLAHKIELCHDVLSFSERLFPAEWRIRGALMFELHVAIAERARRGATSGIIDAGTLKHQLMDSKRWLEECLFMLKYEPEVLPEGKMVSQGEQNMKDLEQLLQRIQTDIGETI